MGSFNYEPIIYFYGGIFMTVSELQNILKMIQDKGYGNVPICIFADPYCLYSINYINYRPYDNCFAIYASISCYGLI